MNPDFTFDAETHTYRHAGRRCPSVTQIIQAAGLGVDFAAVPPEVLNRKREIGVLVHQACQYVDEGDLDDGSLAPEIRPYVDAYRRFLTDTGFESHGTERIMLHRGLGYAGTPDVWGELYGQRAELDRKTVYTVSVPVVAVQMAGYAPLIRENEPTWKPGAARYALQLKRDGSYKLIPVELPGADAVFLAALAECVGNGTPDTRAIIDQWKERHYR